MWFYICSLRLTDRTTGCNYELCKCAHWLVGVYKHQLLLWKYKKYGVPLYVFSYLVPGYTESTAPKSPSTKRSSEHPCDYPYDCSAQTSRRRFFICCTLFGLSSNKVKCLLTRSTRDAQTRSTKVYKIVTIDCAIIKLANCACASGWRRSAWAGVQDGVCNSLVPRFLRGRGEKSLVQTVRARI